MQEKSLKDKAVESLLWKTFEKLGSQLVQLVISIVLARLLAPDDYGTVSLMLVFTSIAMVFIDYGLGYSLIRSDKSDSKEINTTFILSLMLGVVLYLIIYILAPFIAWFYNDSTMTVLTRALALILIIGSINTVQNAILSRRLEYRKIFISNFISVIISGVVGILLAYCGYGVWALIIQQILMRTVSGIAFAFSTKYIPHWEFSKTYARYALSFGWKITASRLLHTIYTNIRSLLIGKIYTTADLAYYNKGERFPGIIQTCTDFSFQNVMFTVYSKTKEDRARIKGMMKKSLITSSYILCPMLLGLCGVAEPCISVVLGETWLPAVPFMQIICIAYSFSTPASVSGQAINAIGRSDETLKQETILRVFATVIIAISIFINIYAVAVTQIIVNIVNLFLRGRLSKKYFDYGYKEQILDLLPFFSLSAIMSVCVYIIYNLFKSSSLPQVVILLFLCLTGAIIYVSVSALLHLKGFNYVVDILKSYLRKGNNT